MGRESSKLLESGSNNTFLGTAGDIVVGVVIMYLLDKVLMLIGDRQAESRLVKV